ncbi:AbrB/MazE/SpoVT family DNA-binding domain-containing protein [Candidatus Bathyarchaeota archaeon]|nr:AbrB/MazE/SpoVT family DNA-binding domain-containing protein [Candidatus Bathyarchaeota archaeon]MCK4702554.1 AbrB/MazE/SpoVT family DNA-binding domain-containing protein [Candidatus Bathyarchaeota archaeon]
MQVEERRVDSQGRVSLPSEWRRTHLNQEGEVVIVNMGEELIIKAKKAQRLSDFFDSVDVELKSDLSDWHRVKNELLRGEDAER